MKNRSENENYQEKENKGNHVPSPCPRVGLMLSQKKMTTNNTVEAGQRSFSPQDPDPDDDEDCALPSLKSILEKDERR